MLLEPMHGVVVSDGYGDYLDLSLTHNRQHLSHCVVVTTPEDKESQRIAIKHDCTPLIVSGARPGGKFNKGMLVERGLQQLPHDGWRLHFDADVILPGNFRKRLAMALYDKAAIYGTDRMNVIWPDGYERLIASGWTHRGWEHQHYLSHSIDKAEIVSRLIYGDFGWVPVGFFQMWHAESEFSEGARIRTYPLGSNSAAHDDVQFALRWDRHKRIFIPEFLVAHLVTKDSTYGANWNGRRTQRVGSPQVKLRGYQS